jgi:hypothetical protein
LADAFDAPERIDWNADWDSRLARRNCAGDEVTRLTKEQEDALLALLPRTSPGQWYADPRTCEVWRDVSCLGELYHFEDSEFSALAKNAMPALLAELAALRSEKARLVEAVLAIADAADGEMVPAMNMANMIAATRAAVAVAVETRGKET